MLWVLYNIAMKDDILVFLTNSLIYLRVIIECIYYYIILVTMKKF